MAGNAKLSDAEIHKLRAAAKLASSMPEIADEVDKMIKSTQNKVFMKINKGELTPDQALSYWMEVFSYVRLLQRFETNVAVADQITNTRRMTDGQEA